VHALEPLANCAAETGTNPPSSITLTAAVWSGSVSLQTGVLPTPADADPTAVS
jgi:hypothetical protein